MDKQKKDKIVYGTYKVKILLFQNQVLNQEEKKKNNKTKKLKFNQLIFNK